MVVRRCSEPSSSRGGTRGRRPTRAGEGFAVLCSSVSHSSKPSYVPKQVGMSFKITAKHILSTKFFHSFVKILLLKKIGLDPLYFTKKSEWKSLKVPVLRNHDILGWIRIRRSMPLTSGSGSGFGSWIRILLFSSVTFKMPSKN
jgi:hypothetical protein